MADFFRLVWWTLFCIFCAVHTPRVEAQTVVERYKVNIGTVCGPSQSPYVNGSYTGCFPLANSPQAACSDFQYWSSQETTPNPYGAVWTSNTTYLAPSAGAPYGRCFRDGTSAQYGPTFGDHTATIVMLTVTTTVTDPSECPKPGTTVDAQIPSIWEGLSKEGALALARAAARGQFGECSNGCTIKRTLSACGGTGDVWRCEMFGGEAVQGVSCGGAGACNLIGNACAPYTPQGATNTPTVEVAPNPVPGGYCPGEVNGVKVYVKCDRTLGTGTDSSTTTTGSGTVTVTSRGETVCSGTSCTTTFAKTSTTSVTGGSSTTATGSSTQVTDKATFCRDNPTHPACKDSEQSRFGGSCNSAFTCSGDAAMCATAKAVNETNCALSKTSAESALYEAEKAKTGNQTTALPGNETLALSSGSFSQANLLGAAQCIPALTVTVMSKTVVLPFSDICPWLEHLGNLAVAISFLASIRIVSRG